MTAADGTVDWRRVLQRADSWLARRSGDDPLPGTHIDAFAKAIEAQTHGVEFKETARNLNGAADSSRELEQLRGDFDKVSDELLKWQGYAGEHAEEIEQLRFERDELRADPAELNGKLGESAGQVATLSERLEEVRRDRDRLADAATVVDLDRDGLVELDQARAELQRVLDDNARLADEMEARQRDLERLGEQHARTLKASVDADPAAVAELEERVELQRQEFDRILLERDALRAEVATNNKQETPKVPAHQHSYRDDGTQVVDRPHRERIGQLDLFAEAGEA